MQCDQVRGPLGILVDTMEWSQRLVINERVFQYMKAYINMMVTSGVWMVDLVVGLTVCLDDFE